MKELEQKKFKVRLVFLIASVCFAQGVMAQTNTITVTPQPEAQVSEEAPDTEGWTPEGLVVVQPAEEETEPYIKEVTPVVKKVNNKPLAVEIHPVPENEAKAYIYMHESGNNPSAINKGSGACGIGQALPCSKMDCELGDYACQDAWFTDYMEHRYGSWAKAKEFWVANRWW